MHFSPLIFILLKIILLKFEFVLFLPDNVYQQSVSKIQKK